MAEHVPHPAQDERRRRIHERQRSRGAAHRLGEAGRLDALAGHVPHDHHEPPFLELEGVEEVAADQLRLVGRLRDQSEGDARYLRQRVDEILLQRGGHPALYLVEAGVLQSPGDDGGRLGDEVDLGDREFVLPALVVDEKGGHYLAAHDQRRHDYGAHVPLALQLHVDARVGLRVGDCDDLA